MELGDTLIKERSIQTTLPPPPPARPSPIPFVLFYTVGAIAVLTGVAAGHFSLACGVFLTSSLAILYLARPDTAVQVLVLYWPFHEILYLFTEGERISLWADSTLVVFTVLWICHGFRRKDPLLPRNVMTWAILSFLGVLLLGLLRAPNLIAGLLGLKWWAMHVPLYFLAARMRIDARRCFGLVSALVLACAAKGLFHLGQLRIGGRFFPSSFPVGGEGMEAHSAYVYLYCFVAILAWAMWPYAPTRFRRLLIILGSLIIVLVIGLSLLRITWLVAGIGVLVVIPTARDLPIKRCTFMVVLLALAWMLAPDTWRERAETTFQPWKEPTGSVAGYSASVKVKTIGHYVAQHVAADGSTALRDQGIWGVGLGSVTSADSRKWIGEYARDVSAPESTYADAFIELGWQGLLAFLAVQLCVIWESYRLTRMLRDVRLRALAAGICGCAVATLVADTAIEFSFAASIYYWYLAGLLVALRQHVQTRQPDIPSRPARREG
jgi:hypothetical protein